MYGFGHWNDVADYVGTKGKPQCIDHYNDVYMNSPCFPLPVRLFDNSVIDSRHAINVWMHGVIVCMCTGFVSCYGKEQRGTPCHGKGTSSQQRFVSQWSKSQFLEILHAWHD